MDPREARDLWHLIETVHAVTYFAPHCTEAGATLGFKGFWMGYFGFRASPLGAVGPAVVGALFAGFAPGRVERAVPDAWTFVDPADAVEGRAAAAAAALRTATAHVDEVANQVSGTLDRTVEAADATGRALFAANREVIPFEDQVADLWQMCTTLREHRGDGHVAVLTSEGLGGCDPHVLACAARDIPTEMLMAGRGWTPEEWAESVTTLRGAGVLDGEGHLTERGRAFVQRIEDRTDELAAPPFAAAGEEARERIRDCLIPIASSVVEAGWVPFPNPVGLPRVV